MPVIKTRCLVCNQKIKKLMIMMHTCRCKGIYCSSCMHNHGCTFDYNEEYKIKSRETMQVVEADKVTKL